MIPKKIHYCWFGRGQKPELALKCIASWKIYLPEYEIKEWNEDNFNLDMFPYVREAYDNRKFAFVTDVVRLYALYTEGGIYMDTDVEVLKPLDPLLDYEAVSGFEAPTRIPTGLMASKKGTPIIKELLDEYNDIHFVRFDGSLDLTTNVARITDTLLKHGLKLNNQLQTVFGFTLLPSEFLCPKSWETGKIIVTKNTYTIHHFSGSWLSDEDIKSYQLSKKLKFLPFNSYVAKFIVLTKSKGLKLAISDFLVWVKSIIQHNENIK